MENNKMPFGNIKFRFDKYQERIQISQSFHGICIEAKLILSSEIERS